MPFSLTSAAGDSPWVPFWPTGFTIFIASLSLPFSPWLISWARRYERGGRGAAHSAAGTHSDAHRGGCRVLVESSRVRPFHAGAHAGGRIGGPPKPLHTVYRRRYERIPPSEGGRGDPGSNRRADGEGGGRGRAALAQGPLGCSPGHRRAESGPHFLSLHLQLRSFDKPRAKTGDRARHHCRALSRAHLSHLAIEVFLARESKDGVRPSTAGLNRFRLLAALPDRGIEGISIAHPRGQRGKRPGIPAARAIRRGRSGTTFGIARGRTICAVRRWIQPPQESAHAGGCFPGAAKPARIFGPLPGSRRRL